MGQDPSVIRAEIEETRERVGDEVDALSHKTDVGARMGDYVDDKKEAVKSKVTGAKDAVTGVVPSGGTIKRGAPPPSGIRLAWSLEARLSASSSARSSPRRGWRTSRWVTCRTA